jgi:hypothetical protein
MSQVFCAVTESVTLWSDTAAVLPDCAEITGCVQPETVTREDTESTERHGVETRTQ